MGEQVGARSKKKSRGDLLHINTGTGKGATLGTRRKQTEIESTGANPCQQGIAVTDSWFYQ